MSKETSNAAASSLSLSTLLTVAFVVLKLCKVIDWSWWWVVSPTLISMGIGIVLLIILAIVYIKHS